MLRLNKLSTNASDPRADAHETVDEYENEFSRQSIDDVREAVVDDVDDDIDGEEEYTAISDEFATEAHGRSHESSGVVEELHQSRAHQSSIIGL